MTFKEIIRFHGHKCPGLAMGYRMSVEAMEALRSMRAEDEELVAIVENDACGVDALQCITGCTFGKGNLIFHNYGKQVYTIYSRVSRSGVRVLFHGMLFKKPVQSGSVIRFESCIVHAGVTGLTAFIQVFDSDSDKFLLEGFITFVHVDETERPTPHGLVIEPSNPEIMALQKRAKRLLITSGKER